MEKKHEQQLTLRLRFGNDPHAFVALYDVYAPRIYRFVYFKVGNEHDAQDLTSEIFLKAWGAYRERGAAIKHFKAFLYQIARNTVVDFYRSKKYTTSLETVDKEVFIESTHLDALADAEDMYEVFSALKALKEEYRELIVFRFIDELGYSDIAEITGKSLIAVRVTLHRAMKALKKLLSHHTHDTQS